MCVQLKGMQHKVGSVNKLFDCNNAVPFLNHNVYCFVVFLFILDVYVYSHLQLQLM